MDSCACGAQLRKFWVWQDSNNVYHASGFEPTHGGVRAVYAATARDALLPVTEGRTPKHGVRDVNNPGQQWEGRCTAAVPA